MLQDKIFNSADFLRLLQYTRGTLDTRTSKGEVAYAFGCPINAHLNEYLPMDAVAIALTSMLSVGIGMKAAAAVVREDWEKWLELVQRAERRPKFGQTILPPLDRLFLIVAVDDDRLTVEAGKMQEAMSALDRGSYANIYGVPIHRVLHALRTNARLYKVDLPARFAVQPDDPSYEQWRAEIAAYQKLARARSRPRPRARPGKPRQ